MSVNSPCLDCTKREVSINSVGYVTNCHDSCVKYIAFRDTIDSGKGDIDKAIDRSSYFYDRGVKTLRAKAGGQYGKVYWRK